MALNMGWGGLGPACAQLEGVKGTQVCIDFKPESLISRLIWRYPHKHPLPRR